MNGRARLVAAAGGSFLVAVLWFDLMFDTRILRHGVAAEATDQANVDAIAAYYRRVTSAANPMGYLVAAVMLTTLGAAIHRTVRARGSVITIVALLCCAAPIALAAVRVLPQAIRLGAGDGTLAERVALARSICLAHLGSLVAMLAFVGLQILPRLDHPPVAGRPRSLR